MNINHALKGIIVTTIALLLAACSATHTAFNKRNLDVQTKMSETIFLDPVTPDKKTAYVQIKNTSDKQQLAVTDEVVRAVTAKGYKIVEDPTKANYLVQANILQVGQTDLRTANRALDDGFGSTLGGALAGATIGAVASDHTDGILMGSLLGAGIATVGDALIKDISFSIITDIQISEKTTGPVTENTQLSLKQGASGNTTLSSSTTSNWKRYQTRVLSTANKVNLKFDEAVPQLVAGLANSIAGLL